MKQVDLNEVPKIAQMITFDQTIDLLICHEPPYLKNQECLCNFGHPYISQLVKDFNIPLVLAGHLYFPYIAFIEKTQIIGLGPFRKGHFFLWTKKGFAFYQFKTQENSIHTLTNEKRPLIPIGDEADFWQRLAERWRKTITSKQIILHFMLQDRARKDIHLPD